MKNILFVACIFMCMRSFAQIDTKSNISDKDKVFGLSKFWSEAAYNFAYFDKTKINWDSTYQEFIPKVLATKSTWEYYNVMEQFAALLKDGHTDISRPNSLFNRSSRYKWIGIEHLNKHFYVTNIGVAEKEKVPLGSEVISVNGVPVVQYVQQNLFPYISASTEHQLWNTAARLMFYGTDTTVNWKLVLKSPEGKTIPYTAVYHTYRNTWVVDQPQWKRSTFKKINDIGYFQANTFGDANVIEDFITIVPELRKCKGVILDLRQNGGGNSDIGAEILKFFTEERILNGSAWQTRDNLSSFRAWGKFSNNKNFDSLSDFEKKAVLVYRGNYWYKGDTSQVENDVKEEKIKTPLIVLIGNNTASAAEDFLIMLSGLKKRAITIGQPTFGSTGQPLVFDLPGGGSARVCTKKDTYPDGKEFVGYGVIPDILVERNIKEIIAGEDATLQVALKEIQKQVK